MDLASHPLVSTMHRLAEINQFFNLPVREPEEDGWIEATDLFLGDDQRLPNLVMTYATALNHPWFAVLPGDPVADHPDSEGVAGKADLYGRLEEWMVDSNLTPVIDALHRAAGASIKVSQNAVANSCTQAYHWLYSASKDPAPIVREASTFFDKRDSPVYGQVNMEVFEHLGKQGFFSRRSGCCLAWRTGRAHGYCSNCILIPRHQQDQQFRDLLERGG